MSAPDINVPGSYLLSMHRQILVFREANRICLSLIEIYSVLVKVELGSLCGMIAGLDKSVSSVNRMFLPYNP